MGAGEPTAADGSECESQLKKPAATAGPTMTLAKHGVGGHLCFILCCTITVYAAFSRSPLVLPVVPAHPAVPFFRTGSPVSDLHEGDLTAALHRATEGHVTLLFLYAPWDLACQRARLHVENVAQLMHGQVEVMAVNCWHLMGSCRKQVKKVHSYPAVLFYFRYGKGLQYTGPLETAPLLRFAGRLLRPLARVQTPSDLHRLRTQHTAVAVSYTPFSGVRPPAAYFSLLRASLLSLEQEPGGQLGWGVVTSQAAARMLGLNYPGGLTVISWNYTTVLKPHANSTLSADVMRNYVYSRRHEMAGWLQLPDAKSSTLRHLVSEGPALLVLAPHRPLSPAADLVRVAPVRRVWLEYNNCNRSLTVLRLSRFIDITLNDLVTSEQSALEACRSPEQPSVTETAARTDSGHCATAAICGEKNHPDHRIPMMLEQQRSTRCDALLLNAAGNTEEDRTLDETTLANITGLSCATNRTLTVHLLDSGGHAALARRLALRTDRPTAVIIDSRAESQYVLDSPLSASSLSLFIANYTAGRLPRHLASRHGTEPIQGPEGAVADGVKDSSVLVENGGRLGDGRTTKSLVGNGGGAGVSDASMGEETGVLNSERSDSNHLSLDSESSDRSPPPDSVITGEKQHLSSSATAKHLPSDWNIPYYDGAYGGGRPSKASGDNQGRGSDFTKRSRAGVSGPPPDRTSSEGSLSPSMDYVDGRSMCGAGMSQRECAGAETCAAFAPKRRRVAGGVTELTSYDFRALALNRSKDVIVLFYSAGCGYCSVVFHVYLAAVRLLANSGLQFTRIDGAANDLPWEFTMDRFPTILYLPAWRKAESRVFPSELPITLSHLLRFILANASLGVRHAFLLGQCGAACRATSVFAASQQAALVRRLQFLWKRPLQVVLKETAELARLRVLLRSHTNDEL